MRPFTKARLESASSLGEEALIMRIRDWLGTAARPSPSGPGDDCALVKPRAGARLLLTSDPVVHGRHFLDGTPPGAVARKLLRRNLSDIAAMGGTPRFAVLSWTIPDNTSVAWLERFHRGLARDSKRFGVEISGGDIASADSCLAAHLTLVGEAPVRPLLRTGARKGDVIFVTGTLGGSILGRHLEFTPRLAEGRWLAGRRGVRCMIDVSDGLAKELRLIAPPRCRASIAPNAVPLSKSALQLSRKSGSPALLHALTDGEDFEILFAVAPSACAGIEKSWKQRFRTRLTRIGAFVPADSPRGDEINFEGLKGYEHLREGSAKRRKK